MKKLLNLGLIITSLIGYIEWPNNHNFLFQVEYQLLSGAGGTDGILHPFVLLPLLGQLLLVISLFQKTPSRLLTFLGLVCLSLIMLFLFLIGCISLNYKIMLASLPFIITGVFVIRANKKHVATTGL